MGTLYIEFHSVYLYPRAPPVQRKGPWSCKRIPHNSIPILDGLVGYDLLRPPELLIDDSREGKYERSVRSQTVHPN
jgi:hypothetical protein